MDAELKHVALGRLLPNPHRDIANYPISEEKVEALIRSIQNGNVGMWPSIIGRPVAGNKVEKAFGHHRFVAATRLRMPTLPIILMPLTDEQMLQYMGRENSEDFGTSFTVLLNTWEAAVKFRDRDRGKSEPLDIARLLGWTYTRQDDKSEWDTMTPAALACNAAYKLISGGYMQRAEFHNMSTRTARDIAQRAVSMMEQVEKSSKASQDPPRVTEAYKGRIAEGARKTAAAVRGGTVAPKDTRRQFDLNTLGEFAKGKTMPKKLFDDAVYKLCTEVNAVLSHDNLAYKLGEIEKVTDQITLDVDHAALDAVRGSLGELGKRAGNWHARLAIKPKDGNGVVPLLGKRGE